MKPEKNYSDAIDQLKENIDRNGELEFSVGKYSYHIEPDYVEKYEVWESKEGVDGCEVIATFKTLDELLNLHCFNGKTSLEIWDEMHRAWFSF